jgi:hypothetical protein
MSPPAHHKTSCIQHKHAHAYTHQPSPPQHTYKNTSQSRPVRPQSLRCYHHRDQKWFWSVVVIVSGHSNSTHTHTPRATHNLHASQHKHSSCSAAGMKMIQQQSGCALSKRVKFVLQPDPIEGACRSTTFLHITEQDKPDRAQHTTTTATKPHAQQQNSPTAQCLHGGAHTPPVHACLPVELMSLQ